MSLMLERMHERMLKRYERLLSMVKEGRTYCTPEDIKEYLDTDPATIRSMAHDCPEKLGFKVVVLGKRVCIPIMPFVMTMTGANYETVEKRCA